MQKKINRNWYLKITLFIVVVLVVIMAILLIFKQKIGDVSNQLNQEEILMDKYYVLIADENDDVLWESVYQGAVQAGLEENIYVEVIDEGDGIEYTLQEKMRIAIDSKVDGIILSADGSEATTLLIDEAVNKDIPVVTAFNDDTKSLKQCFVGVNNYSLGEEYGHIIWQGIQEADVLQDVYRVSVLMDSLNADTGKNTTYLGLKEYLDNMMKENEYPYSIEIEPVAMNRTDGFQSDETIRDIILAGKTDILVCLNSVDTDAAYRSVVDYNQVGNFDILGYYQTEDILEAINKQIIRSTIAIDGEEVGRLCVAALLEYQEAGYVNGYFPVTTYVLDSENIVEYREMLSVESEVADE